MTFNEPDQNQISQLRRLWQQAFGDSDAFLDGFFATGFSPDRCRCLTWNDRVAAALYWFDCCWEDKKVAYIYAVATEENFRGKGFCRSLMEDTHRHLKKLGYHGAILVPGSRELFDLYGKLGYRGCCSARWQEAPAGDAPAQVQSLSAEAYMEKRKSRLPAGGVFQEFPAYAYLATFTGFFEAEGCLFCGAGEETFLFQEFLGDEEKLPGILTALQAKLGRWQSFGAGSDSAMYDPLTEDDRLPAYFALSMN